MLKATIVISGVVMLLATIALVVQNRRSPQIYTFASAMVGGVALSLIVLYQAFQDQETTETVTMSHVLDGATGRPPLLPLESWQKQFPDFSHVIGRLEQANAFYRAFDTETKRPLRVFSDFDNPAMLSEALDVFRDLTQIQALLMLQEEFRDFWDRQESTRVVLGRVEGGDIAGGRHPGTILNREALLAHLSKNRFAPLTLPGDEFVDATSPTSLDRALRTLDQLTLPRNSSLQIDNSQLAITTPYVRLRMRWGAIHASSLDEYDRPRLNALGLQPRGRRGWAAVAIRWDLSYTVLGTKHGHPDIDLHRKWANDVIATLKRGFDDARFWAEVSNPLAM